MESPVSALFLLSSWQREAGGTASLRILRLCLPQLALSALSMLTQHIVPSGWETLGLLSKNNLGSWQGGTRSVEELANECGRSGREVSF